MTSWKLGAYAVAALLAAVALTRYGPAASSAQTWHLLRAAGIVTYVLFWLSALSGMAFYLRLGAPGLRRSGLFELHRVTGVLAAAFLAGHLAAVLVDPWIRFGPLDIVTGLTAPYRPLALFAGALAAWALGIVALTTAFAGRFLYATWLNLHRLAFPGYLLALLHAMAAGSDTGRPLFLAWYGLSAGCIAGMLVLRLPGRIRPEGAGAVAGR
jgi:sulfoxide reductase heme-binding subunit YedZ